MHFLMKIILALYVILYSMDQASSLKCYVCGAKEGDPECDENPKQTKLEHTCPEYLPNAIEANPSNAAAAAHFAMNTNILSIAAHAKRKQSRDPDIRFRANQCWKFRATHLIYQERGIIRGCGSKELIDEWFINVAKTELNMTVETIHRCDTDLCNSSDVLSVGFFNLISSLLFAYSINV